MWRDATRDAGATAPRTARTPRRRAAPRLAAGAVALLALTGAAPAAGAADGRPTLDAASVDAHVRDYLDDTGLPGAVVAVTSGERVVRAAGYGHTAGGRPLTARTPVPVASLSKSMTAWAVLRLAADGRIALDEPVADQLPEFAMADPRAEEITVRQLLHQTSGMADSTHPDLVLPQPDSLAEAVAALRDARLADDPGTAWHYHNTHYAVAARLVEVVSGEPFADYLADAVLRPLGMEDSVTVDSTAEMPEGARGHVRAYGRLFERDHPRWFTGGAFGVVTTADDLGDWLVAQHTLGVSADGRRVLPEAEARLAHTPPEGRDYAMGWSVSPEGERPVKLRHTGQLLTHNAIQILLPERGVGIAVATNTGMVSGDDAVALADGLVDLAEGRAPGDHRPFTLTADWVLAALTVLAIGLGGWGARRARRWARRAADRPRWRSAPGLLWPLAPLALLFWLPELCGLAMGRRGTFGQVVYVWPALVIWTAAGAAASAAVLLARCGALAAPSVRRWRARRVAAAR
ncbi:serine hydrolase domain-containing protein [Streptomyces sedi]|uniref:Beta-lactamase family protein n=1 Tax=Streptomyces sedi TaxID=555059 RepID=A0A5C4UZZ7_9ACTN|nr:serine hydrolase domain-containing protein [Streptomyces sedi]TNM28409.1 beta-lactamase family protein [Streptomyces sedi]